MTLSNGVGFLGVQLPGEASSDGGPRRHHGLSEIRRRPCLRARPLSWPLMTKHCAVHPSPVWTPIINGGRWPGDSGRFGHAPGPAVEEFGQHWCWHCGE